MHKMFVHVHSLCNVNGMVSNGQVEKADTVGRGRGHGHGHEPKFIFSPLQCRTEGLFTR